MNLNLQENLVTDTELNQEQLELKLLTEFLQENTGKDVIIFIGERANYIKIAAVDAENKQFFYTSDQFKSPVRMEMRHVGMYETYEVRTSSSS